MDLDDAVHFVFGGSAGGCVAKAFPGAHVVTVGDPFSIGPCRFEGATALEVWLEERVSWWRNRCPDGVPFSLATEREMAAALERAFGEVVRRGAVVWVDDGADAQLHLCWLASVMREQTGLGFEVHAARPAWKGRSFARVAISEPEELRLPIVTALPPETLGRAAEIWDAFVAPEPETFASQALEMRDQSPFEHLFVLLRRFPSASDGLTYWERCLLERLAEHEGERLAQTIGHVLALSHDETPDFIGDAILFDRLLELARQGLLIQSGDGVSLRTTSFRMTALGRDVLSGRKNRIDEAGFDRWLGGTQLSSSGQMWWLDGESIRRSRPG